ncbi:MAG: hypothetical protein HFI95_14170 [Lachnospiraceae bacterium]|jgi:hypothetical protein|nr:hypothetical protein [Lachnospiraceae bacterium]
MGQELDMEVTPERVAGMKKVLLRLWVDQHGGDENDVTLTVSPNTAVPKKKTKDETA